MASWLAPAAAGEVYKWVDADGGIHYGDAPPANTKTQRVEDRITVVPARPAVPARPVAPERPAAPASVPPVEQAAPTEQVTDSQRERLIAQCQSNRGVDCEAEVDAMRGTNWDGSVSYGTWPIWIATPPRPAPEHPPKPRPPKPSKPQPKPVPAPNPPEVPIPKKEWAPMR
ncbi:MAG: DUF4124 domain-containing protein [Rhodocyclaceae bacterium]